MSADIRSQRSVGANAVVLGASIAGLATAATLAGRFDQISIVERDALPPFDDARQGVPHGRHAHLLLPAGLRTLGQLIPGLLEDLRSNGAHIIDAAEFRFCLNGGRLACDDKDLAISGATRWLIEGVVRQHVRALPGVRFVDGRDVIGLETSTGATTVTGARIRSRTDRNAVETIASELLVDATGRASRSPQWLANMGYAEPEEERLEVGVHYTTRLFRREPATLSGCRHVAVGILPGDRRGGLVLAVEGDRWLVTLVGALGERPPADLEGFVEYARSLWRPELHEVVAGAEPIGEASTGAFPAYLRRRYERLRQFPGGYVIVGDALCSLNPVYAQGMSVAVREAELLGHMLDRHGLDRIGPRFHRRARPMIDAAWMMSTGADLADPAVRGPRPASWRLVNAYMTRLLRVAQRDPAVANAFLEVTSMVAPPQHIMRPSIALRVLRGGRATTRLGASPAADNMAAELRRRGVRVAARRSLGGGVPANPSGLSDREVEVVRLVVAGFTNPQIAAALFISRKTAEHHVSNILVKLGVSSRTEAAAAAVRLDIVGR